MKYSRLISPGSLTISSHYLLRGPTHPDPREMIDYLKASVPYLLEISSEITSKSGLRNTIGDGPFVRNSASIGSPISLGKDDPSTVFSHLLAESVREIAIRLNEADFTGDLCIEHFCSEISTLCHDIRKFSLDRTTGYERSLREFTTGFGTLTSWSRLKRLLYLYRNAYFVTPSDDLTNLHVATVLSEIPRVFVNALIDEGSEDWEGTLLTLDEALAGDFLSISDPAAPPLDGLFINEKAPGFLPLNLPVSGDMRSSTSLEQDRGCQRIYCGPRSPHPDGLDPLLGDFPLFYRGSSSLPVFSLYL